MSDFRHFRRGAVAGWIGDLPAPRPGLRHWGQNSPLLSEEGEGRRTPAGGEFTRDICWEWGDGRPWRRRGSTGNSPGLGAGTRGHCREERSFTAGEGLCPWERPQGVHIASPVSKELPPSRGPGGRGEVVLRRGGEKLRLPAHQQPLTVERGWWGPSLKSAEANLPTSLHRGARDGPDAAKAEAPTEQSSKIQKCTLKNGHSRHSRTLEAHMGKWGGLLREHFIFSQLEQYKG